MSAWLILIGAWAILGTALSGLFQNRNGFAYWIFPICMGLFVLDGIAAAIYVSYLFLVYMGAWPFVPQ